MEIRKIVMRGDVPSVNGHIYPKALVKEVAKKLRSKTGHQWVVSDPQSMEIPIERICGTVSGARMKGSDLEVTIKLLETPHGLLIKHLLNADCKLQYYSLGSGMVGENMIISDYNLTCIGIAAEDEEKGEENGTDQI